MSDGSFWRKVTVDVANHIRPCAPLSAGQMNSPSPYGRVVLTATSWV